MAAEMYGETIRVEGLRELRRELKKLEDEKVWINELKDANFNAATIVANAAKGLGTGFSAQGARAASTIRAGRAAAKATVKEGNAGTPWAAAVDFGAHHNRPRRTARGVVMGWNSVPEPQAGGRFMYPALDQTRPEVLAAYQKDLDHLLAGAFPD
jgi:hypothetical protein